MKGKSVFTASEINLIKKLIKQKNAVSADKQKGIRQKIRDNGFHYKDHPKPPSGYTERGLDELISSGHIKITGTRIPAPKAIEKTEKIGKPSKKYRPSETLQFNSVKELKAYGFPGFRSVTELCSDLSCIPEIKGVYMVLYTGTSAPEFLEKVQVAISKIKIRMCLLKH